MTAPGTLRVALIGTAFMGRAHAHAWRTAPSFFRLPLRPEVTLVVGRDRARTEEFSRRWGIPEVSTDARAAIERADIDLVDVCTPGDTHAELAVAALRAGKHVLCEKPLANTLAEAQAMAAAADEAAQRGVFAMCGYSYRRTPALALARRIVASGELGTLWQVRAQYLQDWLADPAAPWVWRLDRERAGSGALGDIGSHIIDAAQWVTGRDVLGVSALTQTFVGERTAPDGGGPAPVTVDDAAVFSARLEGGLLGVFEATRYATGRKNALRLEISGSRGAVAFDLTEPNVLEVYRAADGPLAGFSRIDVTQPGHPYAQWWPPGHALGYEHAFSHQVADLVGDIASATQPRPSFGDAARLQAVLDAVERSAARDGAFTPVKTLAVDGDRDAAGQTEGRKR